MKSSLEQLQIQKCFKSLLFFLQDDRRRYIELTTFGFLKGGILDVRLENFKVKKGSENELVMRH